MIKILYVAVLICSFNLTVAAKTKSDKSESKIYNKSLKLETDKTNPLVDFMYTADPTSIIHEGRMYVYATNDQQQMNTVGEERQNTYESIHSLVMLSTADMVNWTYHGSINVAAIAPWSTASWAPSIVSRVEESDGKTHFYLYYSNSGNGIGVLTSTSPVGPWHDPLGKNIIDRTTPGLGDCSAPFDPGVVIDDHGIGWLSFGGGDVNKTGTSYMPGNARIVQLGGDMISLGSNIVEIPAPYHFEANELNFLNGTWIYSYCTNWEKRSKWPYQRKEEPTACCMSYMRTKTPLIQESWEYCDNFFKNPGDYGMSYSNNHTHLCKFKGNYYLLYHTLGLGDFHEVTTGYRSLCIDQITVDEKAAAVFMGVATLEGVSQIETLNPFVTQQAETLAATSSIDFEEIGEIGNTVVITKKKIGSILVKGVNFNQQPKILELRVKGQGEIVVQLAEEERMPIISLEFNKNKWSVISVPIADNIKVKGIHDISFFLKGHIEFDEWKFIY